MASVSRSPDRRLAFALLPAAVTVALLPAESPACESSGPYLLEMRAPETSAEGEAPGEVSVSAVSVSRGRGAQSLGCDGAMRSSCDDLGSILLELEPATDPDSSAREVGYVIEVVRGEAPDGLRILGVAQLAEREGDTSVLRLGWIDGATDEQEPLMFWVTIHAIDADGHEGPRSDAVAVVEAGG